MKKFPLVVMMLLLSGCAPKFVYTSDIGKKCFYTCKSDGASCSSKCFGGLACVLGCSDAETYCMRACPDVVEEVTETKTVDASAPTTSEQLAP